MAEYTQGWAMNDAVNTLDAAKRRIAQLEAALMRRTELLEQKQTELSDIKTSKAYFFASKFNNLLDRTMPLHSRRRIAFKRIMRQVSVVPQALWNRRKARNGPTPEERFLSQATPQDEYLRWQQRWEPQEQALAKQRQQLFGRKPKVSIVVPVYNPPVAYLVAMIESVLAQTYSNWELCLADASPAESPTHAVLAKYALSDQRIRVEKLTANRGIAGNTNAALALATGDYIALLDHDDTLAPFAMHAVVSAINETPDAEFLYSDEDKLDATGVRVIPNFKPEWAPETLRSHNYICHLTVIKRSLMQAIGGFREGFDGAQDYDLVLRATERANRVVHIAQVLYHWRMHAQSTALNTSSKNYASEAGRLALVEHLQRVGLDATVQHGTVSGTYKVFAHLRTQPLVSVIIPNKDHGEMLRQCLVSLSQSSYANYEVIVVENGSTTPETFALYDEIKATPNGRVVEWTKPFNYAAVNNYAATYAKGEYILFLNNDMQAINPDWLEALVKVAVQKSVGAVGAKLYYPDDTVQHAGIVIGMGGIAGHSHVYYPREAHGYMQRLMFDQNVAAVTGACLLMPAKVFHEVGGFDEGFVLAFNDVDICLQVLAAGYRIVWTPQAELYHYESKTRGKENTEEKLKRFRREYELFHTKWQRVLDAGDPYYSKHFRLDRADFALKAA